MKFTIEVEGRYLVEVAGEIDAAKRGILEGHESGESVKGTTGDGDLHSYKFNVKVKEYRCPLCEAFESDTGDEMSDHFLRDCPGAA